MIEPRPSAAATWGEWVRISSVNQLRGIEGAASSIAWRSLGSSSSRMIHWSPRNRARTRKPVRTTVTPCLATRGAHSGGSASSSTSSQVGPVPPVDATVSGSGGAGGRSVTTRICAGVDRGAAHEKGSAPGRHLRWSEAPADPSWGDRPRRASGSGAGSGASPDPARASPRRLGPGPRAPCSSPCSSSISSHSRPSHRPDARQVAALRRRRSPLRMPGRPAGV